jgi:hypothetical protein
MFVRTFRLVLATILLVGILASAVAAHETKSAETKLAAAFQLPQLPGLSGPSADWRQWDSFFTFVVKQFGQELSGDLKDSLGDVFLDSRYELTSVIASARGDKIPCPSFFSVAGNDYRQSSTKLYRVYHSRPPAATRPSSARRTNSHWSVSRALNLDCCS